MFEVFTSANTRHTLETGLYLPVKQFLELLGFEVKGEVCGCDLVALVRGEPTALVVWELKLTFSLELQAPLNHVR